MEKTSKAVLNNSGDSGRPCLLPSLREKALYFSTTEEIVNYSFVINGFIVLSKVPFIPILLRVSIMSGH